MDNQPSQEDILAAQVAVAAAAHALNKFPAAPRVGFCFRTLAETPIVLGDLLALGCTPEQASEAVEIVHRARALWRSIADDQEQRERAN